MGIINQPTNIIQDAVLPCHVDDLPGPIPREKAKVERSKVPCRFENSARREIALLGMSFPECLGIFDGTGWLYLGMSCSQEFMGMSNVMGLS